MQDVDLLHVCERGFSYQNRIKTGLRNKLSEQNLENLMKVAIEGAALAEFDFEGTNQIKGTVMVENSDTLCLTLTMLFCLSHSFKNLSHNHWSKVGLSVLQCNDKVG